MATRVPLGIFLYLREKKSGHADDVAARRVR